MQTFYHDINMFISFLQEGVYPYNHMDDWKKFSETLLPEKQVFYSLLNTEDFIDAEDCTYTQKEFAKILK